MEPRTTHLMRDDRATDCLGRLRSRGKSTDERKNSTEIQSRQLPVRSDIDNELAYISTTELREQAKEHERMALYLNQQLRMQKEAQSESEQLFREAADKCVRLYNEVSARELEEQATRLAAFKISESCMPPKNLNNQSRDETKLPKEFVEVLKSSLKE